MSFKPYWELPLPYCWNLFGSSEITTFGPLKVCSDFSNTSVVLPYNLAVINNFINMNRYHPILIFCLFFIGVSCKGQEKKRTPFSRTERFDFYINKWLNQHHFLYRIAEDLAKDSSSQLGDLPAFQELTVADLATATEAITYYQTHIIDKNLLFNSTLRTVKANLSQLPDQVSWKETSFEAALVAIWKAFEPVYEKYFWPSHSAKNEKTLEQHFDRITTFEGRALARLSQLAQAEWPAGKIRVDVSYYADWAGAYTSTQPLHIVISTASVGPEGDWVETLFHEASHSLIGGRKGKVATTIKEIAAESELVIPRQLWHAVLFYFAGSVIQDLLGEEGVDYELFMLREKVFGQYHEQLDRHMKPYLQGEVELKIALERLMLSLQ